MPAIAGAWPAELQTGTPVRVTAPSLADTAMPGSFVRHDDSSLTFKPDHHHGKLRVRFAEIERLEVDRNPLIVSEQGAKGAAVAGGVFTGLLCGLYAAGMTGSAATGVVWGLVMAVPGFLIGGIVGGLIGGTAAVATREKAWAEVPRAEWAGSTPPPDRPAAPADSTTR
ncbi:MAG: hypothetical protein ACHQ52_09610 [Candidatus Eisenbacteria bacterium]